MSAGLRRRALLQGLPWLAAGSLLTSAGAQEAALPLPIPPLLDAPESGAVRLVARPGRTEFFTGVSSETAGYNGAYLGPTLRVRHGQDVRFEIRNELAQETTLHWHGLLVPSEVDGGPHNAIAPGATWRPTVPIRQAATTAWYHAHPHMQTGRQVYAGLAGMLIVTDAQEQALRLPSNYGVDDLPLVLQDKVFDRDGRMVYPASHMTMMHGVQGSVVLVNGAPAPAASVPAGVVRLRLLNAANARVFDLAFDDGRSFHWVGTEGGLLREPVKLRRLSLAPGQRAEVLVDFGNAQPVGLVNVAAPQRAQRVMRFEVRGSPAPAAVLPTRLADWRTPSATQAPRRQLTLVTGMGGGMGGGMRGMPGMHTIDGRPFDMHRVDHRVRLGAVEIWEIRSEGMRTMHPFHIHGVHFEVLRRGGQEPVPEDLGRRDTVIVDEPVELLVHFTQPAAATAPFMYHCHILEHEDMGMMGQFTVA